MLIRMETGLNRLQLQSSCSFALFLKIKGAVGTVYLGKAAPLRGRMTFRAESGPLSSDVYLSPKWEIREKKVALLTVYTTWLSSFNLNIPFDECLSESLLLKAKER